MIEVSSYPPNLMTWDEAKQPFYLEIYGETRPVVAAQYAEVQAPGDPDAAAKTAAATPIYEYWWTIGHTGDHRHLADLWSHLADIAARVYLYFPLTGGWRIKELVATVKYLTPVREQHAWWDDMAKGWKTFGAPAAADASRLAGLVPDPAFKGAAALLGAIAKVQINSVPQVEGFEWSVGKVSTRLPHDGSVMQGIMWTLPKKMFTALDGKDTVSPLGGRLTGSVALSVIPAQVQQPGAAASAPAAFAPQPIRAHALVYGPQGTITVPEQGFVELQVAPQSP